MEDLHYDEYLDTLDGIKTETEYQKQAIEYASEAMVFVQNLNDLFKDQGVAVTDTPDVTILEALIDGYIGELAAATLFLCEKSFARVPEMLRAISLSLDTARTAGDDSTPDVVIKGFSRFADRLENSRVQMQQMHRVLENEQNK